MTAIRTYNQPSPDECIEEGCTRKPKARGYCGRHYTWHRRNGSLSRAERQPEVCVVPWCDGVSLARGLCYTHYQRWNWRTRAGKEQPDGTSVGARGRYKCKVCGRALVNHSVTDPCA